MKNTYTIKGNLVYMEVMCQGKTLICKFDRKNLLLVSSYGTWYGQRTSNGKVYIKCRKNYEVVQLHRLLVKAEQGTVVDHKDGDTLDNTEDNLRVTTYSNNAHNTGLYSSNTSGIKGVSWHERDKVWKANVRYQGRLVLCKGYKDPLEAVLAVVACRNKLFEPPYGIIRQPIKKKRLGLPLVIIVTVTT